jgi:23S rRNA (adenine2030-N6)-methyltransferase
MLSYRHGFHAGNHADVLKHLTVLSCLRLLHKKETPLMLIDTHAGTGVYDLLDRFAVTSKESTEGIVKLWHLPHQTASLPEDLQTYLQIVQDLQPDSNHLTIYPGSPYLLWQSMRAEDKLRLMELHPSDFPLLKENLKILQRKRQDIQVNKQDGFAMLKAFLPPPSRRGLVLMDPSYEDKGDYFAVLQSLKDAIKRFSTGVYLVWYPVLNRIDAKEFPMRLQKLCEENQLPWLHTQLRIKSSFETGLSASGMWIINPPWQLKESLAEILPIIQKYLEIDNAGETLLQTSVMA